MGEAQTTAIVTTRKRGLLNISNSNNRTAWSNSTSTRTTTGQEQQPDKNNNRTRKTTGQPGEVHHEQEKKTHPLEFSLLFLQELDTGRLTLHNLAQPLLHGVPLPEHHEAAGQQGDEGMGRGDREGERWERQGEAGGGRWVKR
jgi:hypothetical protein